MPLLQRFGPLFLAIAGTAAIAAPSDEELVAGLLKSLEPVPDLKRQENVGSALRAFKTRGFIAVRPQRLDYTDFYPLQKSIRVFGHDLVWLEEEYMVKFIGCCVNEGGGFLLRLNGSSSEIAEFASKNQCSLREFDNLAQYRQNSLFKYPLSEGRYAAVSCRVRDERR